MKVSIIVPCYNEQDNIDTLIQAIQEVDSCGSDVEYLLVDNGSTDNTGTEIDRHISSSVKKVVVAHNQGYGYGIQAGIKAATGQYIGWIHGDIQCHPMELNQFFRYLADHPRGGFFMKGRRKNRSFVDRFFTWGQGIVDSVLFHIRMRDIAAIPAIYPANIIQGEITDKLPNDFSIELYAYKEALRAGLKEVRFDVFLAERTKGKSSWNTGLRSKVKQSKRIFADSLKIKRGEKVL